ncbi:hypothetical protein BDU57DRAFT_320080 [Ampelomyces quisqualis]|uniref:Uncharacterized protein n=1 Tax=Ampelomyces quisqualis TaxID=50730 RepID=A0A6A5QI45_AMPQU|nr:hypothetical protein BDU57DRAFT_320080 [Ampelomyces quisqualis]
MRASTVFAASLCAARALAAPATPQDLRAEDLQCRCLSSTLSAKPTLCTSLSSHSFSWSHASSLAAEYDVPVLFAGWTTVARLEGIRRPLPDRLVESVRRGEVYDSRGVDDGVMQRVNSVVCGFGDEVEQWGEAEREGGSSRDGKEELHFVGYVVAGIMLLIVVYMGAEWVWMRFCAQGSIKLEGDEKALRAENEAEQADFS